jgi:pimeloyl-ACP methyl ester carboxylesterase
MNSPPEIPGVRHAFLDVAGLRTHVALAGPEDAPAVMLVHGWPQNWWAWRELIPTLAERFRVIAPDLRGHGWTEATASGYEKEQLTSDLLGVLDALELEHVTWVGHDWGAWSGFLAALRAPERLERLLALCIPHPWMPPRLRQLALLGYQGPLSLPLLGSRLARPMARAILRAGRDGEPLDEADLAIFAERIPAHVSVDMYRSFLIREAIPVASGRYAGKTLEVSSTTLIGAGDLVTSGMQPGLVAGQPNLRVEVIDGVGHWIPEQRPDAVLEWIDWADTPVAAAATGARLGRSATGKAEKDGP